MNSKLGRHHTKAPLAGALSPFMSLLYPPNPWCEWHDEWNLNTTTGSTSPTLFEQWCGFFYVPQEPDKCKCCETGPTVFRPYPRRLESLTVCRCHYKGSTFFSVMLKTLRVGRPGFAPVTSRSADRRFPNRANQIEIGKRLSIIHKYFFYTWLHLLSVAGAKQINEKGVLQANSIYDRKFKWSKPLLVKS